MKKTLITTTLLLTALTATAEKKQVETFRYCGPYPVVEPVKIDTTDLKMSAYDPQSLLSVSLHLDDVKQGALWSGEELPGVPADVPVALHQLAFTLSNPTYMKGKVELDKAPAHYELYLDGESSSAGEWSLEPGTHEVVIKYMSTAKAEHPDSLQVSCDFGEYPLTLSVPGNGGAKNLYTVERMMESRHCYGISVSPKGDWLIINEGYRNAGWGSRTFYLQNRLTGRRTRMPEYGTWMPKSNRYYYTRESQKGRELVTVDPATGEEQVLSSHLPDGRFTMSPNEEYLIFTENQTGPAELNPDVFEVLNPEDRQPGWRDRSTLSIYNLKSGMQRPLTFGHSSHWMSDLSQDGRYMLVGKSENCFAPLGEGHPVERPVRPTSYSSLYRIDLQTLAIDTLYEKEGFASGGQFSPDGKKVLLQGSPEAFGRIGCTLPENVIPSMFDYQAYLLDISTRDVTPLTRDFDPSVSDMEWSTADGMIYLTAENRDSVSLYRLDPRDGSIRMLPLPEEVVKGYSLASQAPVMALYGQSSMNTDRLYVLDLGKVKADKKSGKLACQATCIEDLSAQVLEDVLVADCQRWSFVNSNGDEVLCRYYLPVGFDESQQYPMITYYYGGCSPTARNFESSYPWQCWAALGYAVLVVQPSGAAGFGQEWASRHVNTAGVDPARDITEAVREFCRTHAYINKDKVGCCGASYGGFMTQYLQTLPDCPFACAISHAGISDHTTYWGFGYWGYSYSEVSMANSFPWSETELYVKNSPLYNVDKIHTPILFLHGTEDVNVPLNNSVQMFTALKLLGRETALVCVEGEDHGVVDYTKRLAWLKTSLAWFQKYLKDDNSWWEALYPKKGL